MTRVATGSPLYAAAAPCTQSQARPVRPAAQRHAAVGPSPSGSRTGNYGRDCYALAIPKSLTTAWPALGFGAATGDGRWLAARFRCADWPYASNRDGDVLCPAPGGRIDCSGHLAKIGSPPDTGWLDTATDSHEGAQDRRAADRWIGDRISTPQRALSARRGLWEREPETLEGCGGQPPHY